MCLLTPDPPLIKSQQPQKVEVTIHCLQFLLHKQIKDILKGSLRFNQSQLEAEENEEITIADNHYCSNNRAEGESIKLPQADREMQATVKTEEVNPFK